MVDVPDRRKPAPAVQAVARDYATCRHLQPPPKRVGGLLRRLTNQIWANACGFTWGDNNRSLIQRIKAVDLGIGQAYFYKGFVTQLFQPLLPLFFKATFVQQFQLRYGASSLISSSRRPSTSNTCQPNWLIKGSLNWPSSVTCMVSANAPTN